MNTVFLILSHRPEYLKRLDSQIQAVENMEHIAYYNGQEKFYQKELKKIKLHKVKPEHIRNSSNELFLYKARIESMKLAAEDTDIICLLDDDVQFFDGYSEDIAKVLSYFEEKPEIGLITTQPDERKLGVKYNIRPLTHRDAMTAGVHSGMFIRKSVADKIDWDEYADVAGGGEDSLIASLLFNECYSFNIGTLGKIYHPVGQNEQTQFFANMSIQSLLNEEIKHKFRFSDKNGRMYSSQRMSPYKIPAGGLVAAINGVCAKRECDKCKEKGVCIDEKTRCKEKILFRSYDE